MSEDKFDAIVVGGGLAGISASIMMAREGLDVLLLERGTEFGGKNMTGGRLYGHSMEKILPDFAKEAPIERIVKKEKISLMTKDSSLDIQFASKKLSDKNDNASYIILRSKFDKWFSQKAEQEGVACITDIKVDNCIVKDGKVIGISAAGEEMFADVVILADGVNSLLAQDLGMKQELKPNQVAVGAKEIIKLDEEIINQRFGLRENEGMSWLSAGNPTDGSFGGGFIYTNKDTVSVGIVATLSDIGHTEISVAKLLDNFKNHPCVAPFLEGGQTAEYSAHLVPEEGLAMVPELYRDGVLVTGDAAGFCINLGFTVRGMDFAIESGRLAAQAVIRAHKLENFSKEALSFYKTLLDGSFVMKDLAISKGFPTLLSQRQIFEDLPETADDIASKIFTVDSKGSKGLMMDILESIAARTSARELVDFAGILLEAF